MERATWQGIEGSQQLTASKKQALSLTAQEELNAVNNHRSLEASPSPVKHSDESPALVEILIVRNLEAENSAKPGPLITPILWENKCVLFSGARWMLILLCSSSYLIQVVRDSISGHVYTMFPWQFGKSSEQCIANVHLPSWSCCLTHLWVSSSVK